jgi:hypothetical protein
MTQYNVSQHVGSLLTLSIFALVSFIVTLNSGESNSCFTTKSVEIPLPSLLLVNSLLAPLILGFAFCAPVEVTAKSLLIHIMGVFAFIWNIVTAVSLFKDNGACFNNSAWQCGVAYYSAFLSFYPWESFWTMNRSATTYIRDKVAVHMISTPIEQLSKMYSRIDRKTPHANSRNDITEM